MKKIFVIDWWVTALFVIMAVSGFGMHISGTRCPHEIWHNWAIVHTLSSIAFLIAGAFHIQTHWAWYKGWFKNGIGNKSRVTAILSIIFVVISITGILLLAVIDGANSGLGLWHYRFGIAMTIIGLGHFIKRFPILKKSLIRK
ncbi:MAG: DUF4405 domain-containing protein [Muribaculaceae bacterium]|nr:DUF4405 domain-containing protein [Muribaculaceae bacterium]